eukprot:996097-Pyramimonas_sp.AAC.1
MIRSRRTTSLESKRLRQFSRVNESAANHINPCPCEDSLTDRLQNARGRMPIDQVERLYVIGSAAFDSLDEVKRKNYLGTNRGNFAGPIKAPDWGDERETRQLPPANKKK